MVKNDNNIKISAMNFKNVRCFESKWININESVKKRKLFKYYYITCSENGVFVVVTLFFSYSYSK